MIIKCPLENPFRLINQFDDLVRECDKAKCYFVRSGLDDLPANCVLLVAGLVACKKETAQE